MLENARWHLLLFLLSVVFALGAAELALQLLDYPEKRPSGWWSKPPLEQLNQLRFRGRQIQYDKDDFVVVLLVTRR